MTRPNRGRLRAAALLAGLVLLTGCTDDAQEPPSTPAGSSSPGSTTEEGSASQTEEPTSKGPSSDELSAQVLDAAQASAEVEAIGAGTADMPFASGEPSGDELTLEVLSVTRAQATTLVRMRVSTTGEPFFVTPQALARPTGPRSLSFSHDFVLEDPTVTKTRYLPLQFEDHRVACVCPYHPIEVGPQPQIISTLYPALPAEVTTVTLQVGRTKLTIANLPVTG